MAESSRRRGRLAAAVGIAIVALAACGAPASRYSSDGEQFLRSDEVFNTYNVDFTEPQCERPTSTSEGGEMLCRAVGAEDGHRYVFTFVVTGGNAIELQSIRVVYTDDQGSPNGPKPSAVSTARPTTTAAG